MKKIIIRHEEDAFFKKVSERCDYMDPEAVRQVYIGLVKYIFEELKSKQKVVLPQWGRYEVISHKARVSTDVNTGASIMLEARNIIKFRPCEKFKNFIKNVIF